MHHQVLSCPPVGHRTFEKQLPEIVVGEVERPSQISKFVRPANRMQDELGVVYAAGELQRVDLAAAMTQFAYPRFIAATFNAHTASFRDSEFRIYQFQTTTTSSGPFIFGLFITDGKQNLVDFCVDSPHTAKRRDVLKKLIRALCTPQSVLIKFSH